MSTRGRILLVLAISAACWLGYQHHEAHGGLLSGAHPASRFCAPYDGGSAPYRIQGLSQIDSIEFVQGDILVAHDRMGQLWRYVPMFGGSCVKTHPEKFFPGPAFSSAKPPVTEVHTTHSTANSLSYVITGQKRIAMFQPYEVADVCGIHDEVCPLAIAGFTDVIDVAGSTSHTLAARADGSLWASGSNDCGQTAAAYLARGSARPPRIQSISALHNVIAVGAGVRSSIALERDGSVWQWGNMSAPEFGLFNGDGPDQAMSMCHMNIGPYDLDEKKSSVANNVPERVAPLPPVQAISSYWAFDLALARDGTVWGWGNNSCGQLGIDTRQWHDDDYYLIAPHRIEGLQDIAAIAAGQRHALALDTQGAVWAWGVNGDRQLGQTLPRQPQDQRPDHCWKHTVEPGGENSTATPLRVPGIPHIVAIAAGEDISAAVDSDGHVWLWGRGHP
jgi:alpha-tubulin suppressor-like RCC1 family protein